MKEPRMSVGGGERRGRWMAFGIALAVTCCALPLRAQSLARLTTADPTAFFTNVAARLLRSQLNLDLNSIQVYPTNQYTPAVHRLLQVTANLYDCTTNRVFSGATTYPYCPTVFRPIFRRTTILGTNAVFIVGFREVIGTTLIAPGVGAPDIELDTNPLNVLSIPPMGTPVGPPGNERGEPLVSGVPLVIGVRKGFPNFNEFSMQTYINVSRLLEFRRDTIDGPVTHTNQMYVAAITNAFGLEAWNAYVTSYPRPLELIAVAKTTAQMTNELGNLLLNSPVTNVANVLTIGAGGWPGWTTPMNVGNSFLLPWGINGNFNSLPNASYSTLPDPPQFIPLTHVFATANAEDTYPIPHWWLNLNTRVRYILVDTSANRIVDYVDLDYWQPTLDLNAQLAPPSTDCSGNPAALSDPVQRQWVLFCTNRVDGSLNVRVPTQGIVNQISLGLGINPNVNLASFSLDTYAGLDAESAMDGFRYNLMGWGPAPQNPKDIGKTFYRSNIFYAPFAPNNPVFIHLSLQANDPLVHYTIPDLGAPLTNMVNNISDYPPLSNLGLVNVGYQPWGGNPFGWSNPVMPPYEISAKDPGVARPDAWNFPTNQPLGPGWLGQVHRGTPWQTLFLKSANVLARFPIAVWQTWTGDQLYRPTGSNSFQVPDALATAPTNDWQIVSLLAPWFNTTSPTSLADVNQPNAAAWASLLDGMTALTNSAPGQWTPVSISSNSPETAVVAQGLAQTRAVQFGGAFSGLGDVLATPELTVASPWQSQINPASQFDSDEAIEILASQLISLMRPDSIGAVSVSGGMAQIQFTGFDAYAYRVETSTNLVDWTGISTKSPTNGIFQLFQPASVPARYYRSELVP